MQFKRISNSIVPADFPSIQGYINGATVPSYIQGFITNTSSVYPSTMLQVIPNPIPIGIGSQFHLKVEDLPLGDWTIQIYSITGQLIQSEIQTIYQANTQIPLNLRDVGEGMYLLRMMNSDGVILTRKFIVNDGQ